MTTSNPDKHSGSRPRGGAMSRGRTGGDSQRIFLAADKVVDRPPVLFRMPTVKVPDAGVRTGSDVSSAKEFNSAKQRLAEQEAVAAPARLPSDFDEDVEGTGAALGSGERIDAASERPSKTTKYSKQNAVKAPHFLPQSSAEEDSKSVLQTVNESDRSVERTPKSIRPNPQPEPVDVPAGRGWIEIAGSRLIIVLLVVALATAAYLANRDGLPSSEAELAILEIGSPEQANSGAMADSSHKQDANVSSVSNRSDGVAFPQISELTSPKLDKSARDTSAGDSDGGATISATPPKQNLNNAITGVEAVKPDFDLTQLMGSGQAEVAKPVLSALNPPSLDSEMASPSSDSDSDDWQQDLEDLGNTVDSYADVNSGANGFVAPRNPSNDRLTEPTWSLSRPEGGAVSAGQGDHWAGSPSRSNPLTAASGSQGNDRMLQDQAIQAAIDAAVSDRVLNTNTPDFPSDFHASNGYPPAPGLGSANTVVATDSPAGVNDWSRYLPATGNAVQQRPGVNYQPPGSYQAPSSYQPAGSYQQPNGGYPVDGGYQMGPGYQPSMMPPGPVNRPNVAPGVTDRQTFTGPTGSYGQPQGFTTPQTAMLPANANSAYPANNQSPAVQPGQSAGAQFPFNPNPSSSNDARRR